MNYSDYFEIISQRFSEIEEVQIESFNVKSVYEEKFELKWLASKLKIFSFLSHVGEIDSDDIITYSSACMRYALKSYKGLPRGMQNGVASFNVLVSNNVSKRSEEIAIARPKKHFASFEMPIVYDLANKNIYYYKNTPIWGSMYYKFFREYIEMNFNI